MADLLTSHEPGRPDQPLVLLIVAQVSTLVHALVGGAVEHIGTDDEDLSDSTKLVQRL